MSWFKKKLEYHCSLRSNAMPHYKNDGTMITLAGQDLAHAVQLFIEEKFEVTAQWVDFTMERTGKSGETSLRALVKVYERKKDLKGDDPEVPYASNR